MTLALQDLHKSFGEKKVLRGISLEASSGKAVGLLGRNGAGKTTTIRIVMDVFPADSGQVLLDGKRFNRASVKIGYLPEERGLYPRKKVMDQLLYFAALRGVPHRKAAETATGLLKRLEADEYAGRRLNTLSKGNAQKIQLAAALITDPDIVILDEPFSGFDPVNAGLLKSVVREQIGAGKIVFFSCHQMDYIEEFCEEIAILNGGGIAVHGKIRDIKRSFDRRTVRLYTQEPEKVAAHVGATCRQWVEHNEGEREGLTVVLRESGMVGALMRHLAAGDLPLEGFVVVEPTLTDIFVKYAGDGV
jgi:ABC-2 type transport system ATP-binding protein